MFFSCADGKLESLENKLWGETSIMNGEQSKEEWIKLCEQAAVEQDPEKLMHLTREICRLLEERENALKRVERRS